MARGAVGIASLGALLLLGAAIAAGGPEAVPAAGRGGDPAWIEGVFGGGLGLGAGAYIWLERAAFAAYLAVLACASAIPSRLLWGTTAVAIAMFTLAPPLLSLDVFSYVAYARLDELHGLNPYEFGPASAPGDESLAFVEDWRDSVSVYGPLFTLATLPLAHVGVAGAVWSLKAVAGLAVAASAVALARLAAARGVDPRFAVALVALNPLVLVHVVGGGHNDALMAALMVAAIAATLAVRPTLAGAGSVAAAAVKASAVLVAPFALIGTGRRGRFLLGLGLAAVAIVAVALAAFGGAVDEAVKVAGQNQSIASRASVPDTISRELDLDLDLVRPVTLALWLAAAAALLSWIARGADWVRALGWATVALLAATSYLTPWYVIWALPTVAIARDGRLVAVALALSAFLLREQVPGLGG